jgi:hypothetical protein
MTSGGWIAMWMVVSAIGIIMGLVLDNINLIVAQGFMFLAATMWAVKVTER